MQKATIRERKTLTRENWVELINKCFSFVQISNAKIDFRDDGVHLDGWIIGYDEKLESNVLAKGYNLVSFRDHLEDGEIVEVIKTDYGFFNTPYEAISYICRKYLEDQLCGVLEGFVKKVEPPKVCKAPSRESLEETRIITFNRPSSRAKHQSSYPKRSKSSVMSR